MSEEEADAIKAARGLLPFWGVFGVVAFLANGLRRVLPLALEPFRAREPVPPALGLAYVSFGMFMAYFEGYRGFHRKFSPNVVARALTLGAPGVGVLSRLFAPLYCMELFGAPAGRVVSAWSFLTSIVLLVAGVKRLPPTARSVVDAGVCVGMGCGTLSIFYHYANAVCLGIRPLPQVEDKASLCPVTMLSGALTSSIKLVVGTAFGKQAADRLEEHLMVAGKGLLKCPISGKNGTSEAECPMATFVANVGASAPAESGEAAREAPGTKTRTD